MADLFINGICTNTEYKEKKPCPKCADKKSFTQKDIQKIRLGDDFVCKECGRPLTKVALPKSFWETYGKTILCVIVLVLIGFCIFKCCTKDPMLNLNGPNNRTIKVGETDTLRATTHEGDSVIWEVTEGKELVSVVGINDSIGVVTALKEGEKAVVVASLYEKPDVKDTCIYKVNPAPISISFDSTSITLVVGKSMPLSPRVEPNELSAEIKWNSDDRTKVTVTPNGVITGVAVGKTKITAEIRDEKVVIDVEVIKDTTSSNNDDKVVNQGGLGTNNTGGTTSQGGQRGGDTSRYATIDLGYATYYGPINTSRQPHGLGGELKFKRYYEIDLKKASGEKVQVGDGDIMIECKYENGKLIQGQLIFSHDGERWIHIGK